MTVVGGGAPTTSQREHLARAATGVLHLGHDLSGFYAAAADDPELAWVTTGAGRMLRSPTVWEDVVKTVCTTNCSWGLTTKMVTALVTHLGEPAVGHAGDRLANAFPTPAAMAAQPESFYRETVRSGYRAPVFVRLAAMVAAGEVDLEALGTAGRDDLPDEEVERRLLALPGVGPVRGGAHRHDPGQEQPVDPGLVDQADLREARRAPPHPRRRHDRPPLPPLRARGRARVLAVRDARLGRGLSLARKVAREAFRGHTARGPDGPERCERRTVTP